MSRSAAAADYVVVGSGSAGAIVARRLADSGASVILVESGRRRRNLIVTVPGMCGAIHAAPFLQRRLTWPAYTAPQQHMNGRTLPQSHGRVVGGGSVVNGMAFVRGNRRNYDDWAAEGNVGWGFDDVLPAFKKLESFEGGDSELRGRSGPITVERATGLAEATESYLTALAGATGTGFNDDYNGAHQSGVAALQQSVGAGRRVGTDRGYLRDLPRNLRLLTGMTATRVIIEGDRAVGVELIDGPGGTVVHVRAEREVIVSAGSLGTPRLLMLSGIGPASHLAEHGIDVAADLPVGNNLHDHLFVPISFTAEGGRSAAPAKFASALVKEKLRPRSTYLSHTLFEGVGFVPSGVRRDGDDVPDLQVFVLPMSYPSNQDSPGVHLAADSAPALTLMPTMIYPESRGTVRLSSTDPFAAPVIDPNYLAEKADLDTLVAGMELVRETISHPAVAPRIGREVMPGIGTADPASLGEFVRRNASGVYHPVGTCRMGVDDRAVVDPELKVRGIDGLRVVDASIMPSIVGGNTNAAAMMIGERAAELLTG